MKSSAKKVELASVDDLFSTEESRLEERLEKIQEIPLSELHPFKNYPFKVKDDEAMLETADSIKQYGVLVPAIARPDPEGGYELVAGHRRHRASELAEKETMPVIVRDLDDDAATIIMVDSNFQRESLLPSERAFAYKMKLEAMRHQGERMDLTSAQVGRKLAGKESREILAEQVGQSRNQISRYIRLAELIPELMDMVDERKIALNPAYELSFLLGAGYSESEIRAVLAGEKQHTPRKKSIVQPEPPKVKDLQAEYAKLLEEKKKTYAEYRRSREEMRELLTAKANVDRLLKMDEEQKKEQEKDHGQR
ncbi:ParB/RepB/Spo0J family partition protein [Peptostreptococcus anaerobius]|uniref:ParB/RepB/Spo0J family partition protein n=1 Tax=Peptostreptococcus anaerobius TaxID=1261 RepID=UPI0034A4B71D